MKKIFLTTVIISLLFVGCDKEKEPKTDPNEPNELLPEGCNSNVPGWGNSIGTVSFATNQTWTIGSQTWSDAVRATNCQSKTTFLGYDTMPYTYSADCRSNPGQKGDLFSWCAVARYANTLCPSPWRVPAKEDFIALDVVMGGTGGPQTQENVTLRDKYLNTWGGAYGGRVDWGDIIGQGEQGWYWSKSERYRNEAETLYINVTYRGFVGVPFRLEKYWGLTLRCVRDN